MVDSYVTCMLIGWVLHDSDEVTPEEGRKRLITAVQTAMVHGYRLIDTTLFSGRECFSTRVGRWQDVLLTC